VSAIHEVRQLSQYYCERHIYLAVLIGVAPCPPRWVLGFLTVFSAIALVTAIVSPWLLGEGATAWLLSGPVVIAMVGWSTHLVSAAAIRHTTEREGTLGDLRKMLDATHSACASCAANRPGKDGKPAGKPALGKAVSPQAGAVTDLVDSASIARAWTEGPIVWIYAGLLSVGAAYFVVSFIRGRLMPSSRAYAGEELEKYIQHPFTGVFLGAASALPIAICCGVSRKRTYAFARGLYAMNMLTHVAHLWRKLNEIRFLLETWPEPEDDLAAMSSPAGAFMSGMLAVLMPRSRAELILNVSLVAAKHLGSSVSRALRMRFDEVLIGDVVQHISMAGLGVATVRAFYSGTANTVPPLFWGHPTQPCFHSGTPSAALFLFQHSCRNPADPPARSDTPVVRILRRAAARHPLACAYGPDNALSSPRPLLTADAHPPAT
jgi:hypothetical protein